MAWGASAGPADATGHEPVVGAEREGVGGHPAGSVGEDGVEDPVLVGVRTTRERRAEAGLEETPEEADLVRRIRDGVTVRPERREHRVGQAYRRQRYQLERAAGR